MAKQQEQEKKNVAIEKSIQMAKEQDLKKSVLINKAKENLEAPEKKTTESSQYSNAITATLNALKSQQPTQAPEPAEDNTEKAAKLAEQLVAENPEHALKLLEEKPEEQAPVQ